MVDKYPAKHGETVAFVKKCQIFRLHMGVIVIQNTGLLLTLHLNRALVIGYLVDVKNVTITAYIFTKHIVAQNHALTTHT